MQVVIVGCGRVGANLASSLADEGHDVVIVDKSPESFDNLGVTFNGVTIQGTGIDQDVLRRAGIEHADAFAAVTSSDSVNLMAAQVARTVFGVQRVVARTNDPGRKPVFEELSIPAVCPTDLGAAAIKGMLHTEGIQTRDTLGAGEVIVIDLAIDEQLDGSLASKFEIPGKIRACAVVRGGKAAVVSTDFTCQPGDTLVLCVRIDVVDTLRGPEESGRRNPGRELSGR